MSLISKIKLAWTGQEKLWKVFWVYYVAGNFIWIYFSLAAGTYAYRYNNYEFLISIISALDAIVPLVGVLIFFPTTNVLVWRCSKNTTHIFWGKLIRLILALSALIFAAVIGYGIILWWAMGCGGHPDNILCFK